MTNVRRASCALALSALFGASCGGDDEHAPTTPAVACGDGADNDQDGLRDLEDPGCGGATDPDETDPPFPPVCSNGIDDDADGVIDGEDPGCVAAGDGDETDPFRAACSNDDDDDGDGLVDGEDPGCTGASDMTEGDSACTNGIDDDGDYKVDLRDSDCLSSGDDTEGTTQCFDLVDNDGDGLRDWEDPGCRDSEDTDETDPAVAPACSNGIDDDGDGRTDYPVDPGCRGMLDSLLSYSVGFGLYPGGPGDDSERGPFATCDNGFDDDGNGVADFPDDPSCTNALGAEGQVAACADFVDNDADGARDLEDRGCTNAQDDDETDPEGGTQCSNGVDDDGDGRIDVGAVDAFGRLLGGDPGCTNAADLDERNRWGAACDNGLDDDADGAVDFPSDADCRSPTGDEFPPPHDACGNGDDDDGDGLADALDPGCDSIFDSDETDPLVAPVCGNGIDDDGDGFVDYPEDPGCPRAGDTSERERTGAECDNGIDDDADGTIDAPADADCAGPFGTETPAPVWEEEPNDDPAMAQPVANGMRVSGCLDMDWGDAVDWYVIDLAAGERLTVDLAEECGMDSAVFVYEGVPADPGGDVCDPAAPAPAAGCDTGYCPRLVYDAAGTNAHYLRVVPAGGWSGGCYILGVTVE